MRNQIAILNVGKITGVTQTERTQMDRPKDCKKLCEGYKAMARRVRQLEKRDDDISLQNAELAIERNKSVAALDELRRKHLGDPERMVGHGEPKEWHGPIDGRGEPIYG